MTEKIQGNGEKNLKAKGHLKWSVKGTFMKKNYMRSKWEQKKKKEKGLNDKNEERSNKRYMENTKIK